MKIAVVGLGAIGSFFVDAVRSTDAEFTLIDFDKVEAKNVASQNFDKRDVGKNKATVLTQRLKKLGAKVSAKTVKVTSDNAEILLRDIDLVVDCTDNNKARSSIYQGAEANVLHIAIDGNGVLGIIEWDSFDLIDDAEEGTPTCEDGQNRAHHVFVAAAAAKVVQYWIKDGRTKDLEIRGVSVGRLLYGW